MEAESKRILDSWGKKKVDREGGVSAKGVGKFRSGASEKNKKLTMSSTMTTPTTRKPTRKGFGGRAGSMAEKRNRDLMVSDEKWGNWEKNTSGFGSRMLEKVHI